MATVAGLLAILALALRQILASIGRYQEVARSDPETPRADVVARVTPDRVGAVVTSIAVTGLALLPMLVLGPIAGQELVQPMAIVMIGGLITTALATLYVVPPLYARFGPRSWPDEVALVAPAPVEASVPVGETVGAARRTGLTPMTYSEGTGRIDDV